jgi:glucokinase
MSNAKYAIGADIGGTHITAALVDLQHKKIITSSVRRAGVNSGGTADEIINDWANCITDARQNNQVESICLAMPGPFDYEAGISLMRGQAKYESLYQLNIKERLAKALNLPAKDIFMENDAACFLQGEIFNGTASKYADHTVIGITLGTGLGSAVYKAGKSHNADMWHHPFKGGIAEDLLCTRWFVHRWKKETGETVSGVREMKQSVARGKVKEVFSEFGTNLAEFLLEFIAKESPVAVVIGGNIAKSIDWFGPTLTALINEKHPTIKIEQAILGEEAPLSGAVSSWLQKQRSSLTLS